MWALTSGEDWRIDWLEQEGATFVRALGFLRTLAARCGIEVADAYRVWRELPNNWSNINREVFLDLISDTYRVKVKVTKYSGEEVEFEGNADTMLDLSMHFLRTLNYIPKGYPFTPSVAENFVAEAESLIETIKAGAEGAQEPAAEAASA
jgi:hypothetical protein